MAPRCTTLQQLSCIPRPNLFFLLNPSGSFCQTRRALKTGGSAGKFWCRKLCDISEKDTNQSSQILSTIFHFTQGEPPTCNQSFGNLSKNQSLSRQKGENLSMCAKIVCMVCLLPKYHPFQPQTSRSSIVLRDSPPRARITQLRLIWRTDATGSHDGLF